jgi:cold shock CspA family protein
VAAERDDDPSRAGRPVSPYSFGAARKVAPPARHGTRPVERHGIVTNGRIVKLLVGKGHGFIRLADGREIFFHRADVGEGVSINDFVVGDRVTFELLEDTVSGARALRVSRREPHR